MLAGGGLDMPIFTKICLKFICQQQKQFVTKNHIQIDTKITYVFTIQKNLTTQYNHTQTTKLPRLEGKQAPYHTVIYHHQNILRTTYVTPNGYVFIVLFIMIPLISTHLYW